MVQYLNDGLKTGLKKACLWSNMLEWSAKSRDFAIWIPDTHTDWYSDFRYSGVRYSDGYCNQNNKNG